MIIPREKIKKILVISLQGIGDLLLFTPCLPVLKRNFPGAKISIVVFDDWREVLLNNEFVDEIIAYSYKKHNFYNALKLLLKIRKQKIDLAICAYPGGLRTAFFSFFSGAPFRCGHHYSYLKRLEFLINLKVEVRQIKHAVEMNLDLMKSLGLGTEYASARPIFRLTEREKIFAINFLNSGNYSNGNLLIGMHATGQDFRTNKCWPVENFIKLAQRLIENFNARILLLGVSAELKAAKDIEKIAPDSIINAVGKTTLKQAGALIEKCSLFIGNDSALMHVASAVGTPVVAIFGPTDPRIFSPYGVTHKVVSRHLECSPCAWGVWGQFDFVKKNIGFVKGRFYCKRGDFECIKGIILEEVYAETKELLAAVIKSRKK